MATGRDLWREHCPPWQEGGSFLLLNPRLDEARRAQVLGAELPDLPDHVWLATSGTSGSFKLVALSRESLECSAMAVNGHLTVVKNDVWLNALPLFHVGGLGVVVRAYLAGVSCHTFSGNWDANRFVAKVQSAGATLSALVPTQIHDLVRAELRSPECLRGVVVGGGATIRDLFGHAARLGWPLLPSYGLTEAASQVATANPGDDYSEWLPFLPHVEARPGEGGVLELRGRSLLSGWIIFDREHGGLWQDPKTDGWYRTNDRVELRDKKLRVLGRMDDLIKIRGELVDVAGLERVLQQRVPSGCVVLRAEAGGRGGFSLRLIAENVRALSEAESALDVFPPYARPDVLQVAEIERNALGKVMRRTSIS